MRPIDADALLKEVKLRSDRIRKGDGFDFSVKDSSDSFLNGALMPSTEWWCVEDLIENAPTIDAVEVVRCRDCKWWKCNPYSTEYGVCKKVSYDDFEVVMDSDDFCSYGRRREEDE